MDQHDSQAIRIFERRGKQWHPTFFSVKLSIFFIVVPITVRLCSHRNLAMQQESTASHLGVLCICPATITEGNQSLAV